MANRKLNNKGQATIETAAIFIVLILLFGGIFNIWLWGNKQIVKRQRAYNKSRVEAGTSSDKYELKWPLEKAESLKENTVVLTPP